MVGHYLEFEHGRLQPNTFFFTFIIIIVVARMCVMYVSSDVYATEHMRRAGHNFGELVLFLPC